MSTYSTTNIAERTTRGVREAAGRGTEAQQAAGVQEVGALLGRHETTRHRILPEVAREVDACAQLERVWRHVHEHHLRQSRHKSRRDEPSGSRSVHCTTLQ